MPRKPRLAPANFIYHIISRGNNKQTIFMDDQDHFRYLHLLKKYKDQYKFLIYHYVLMNNHVHIMGMPLEEGLMSKLMRRVNCSYALYFRRKYGGIGHFWQDRFKSLIILTEEYHFKCASYVELNPVKAGLVKHPHHYKWSSYSVYAYGSNNGIVDIDPLYKTFGDNSDDRKIGYVDFINYMAQNPQENISDNTIQKLQEGIFFKLRSLVPPSLYC
ncbi:MAG: transposase IS200-family protein [Candidatus Peregrinibacteria bacterium GW2011_GWF2_38_29]|nr:MAG: transposase IS200-family protein [Candidatus Peregrinibacteria bacterium GW2011_GWF2_38_29]HBB03096.1 hypothetical protein [Candidatus Peregrinibacteria bacterium]